MRCVVGLVGFALFSMAPCLWAQMPEKSAASIPVSGESGLPIVPVPIRGPNCVALPEVSVESSEFVIQETGEPGLDGNTLEQCIPTPCCGGEGDFRGELFDIFVSLGNRSLRSPAKAGIKPMDVIHSITQLHPERVRLVGLKRKLSGAVSTIPVLLKRDGKLLTQSLKVGAQCLGKVVEAAARQGSEQGGSGKSEHKKSKENAR